MPDHAILTLRWTKSRQSRSHLSHIQVPLLPDSPLSPVAALRPLFLFLFSWYVKGHIVSLPQVQACQALAQLCQALGLEYKSLGFHAFRKSGVSFLYANRMGFQHLQHHGTWSSNAIYHYLANSSTSTVVPSAFRSLLS